MTAMAVQQARRAKVPPRPPRATPAPSLHSSKRVLPTLQKKTPCACGGTCPRCVSTVPVQAKLAVSQPGDAYEREADRVADEIMRSPQRRTTAASRSVSKIQRKCAVCADEEEVVRRTPEAQSETKTPAVPEHFLKDAGAGQPLDLATREFFEPAFGRDFGEVRVHIDAQATRLAERIGARAFTLGRDVFFKQGQFEPGTRAGRRLVAHELTHVIQQEAGAGSAVGLQRQAESAVDECGTLGPAGRESGPPLVYHYLEARQRGISEALRSKRPTVGYAQRRLNEFLRRYDNTKTGAGDQIGCVGDLNKIEAKRQRLPKRLTIDCWFGDDTKRAVEMFQMCTGLKVDGKIGEATWPMLEQSLPSVPPKPAPKPTPKEEPPKITAKTKVCGPDITAALSDAVGRTKAAFGSWTSDDKEEACSSLDSMPIAAIAWDIETLATLFIPKKTKSNWLRAEYGLSGCANPLNSECNPTVQVGTGSAAGCWFPESVNYVIFGVMFRLCHDAVDYGFTEKYMAKTLIESWKYMTFQSRKSPSAKAWASAGFRGWPAASTPTKADEPGCRTICPVVFPKPNAAVDRFDVRWMLHYSPLGVEIRWI